MKKIILNLFILLIVATVFFAALRLSGVQSQFTKLFQTTKEIQNTDKEKLEEELSKLKLENKKLTRQNDEYKEELEIKNKTSYKELIAQINYRNINSLDESFVINLGENDGIKINQLVLHKGKLIGIIASVEKEQSKVKPLNTQSVLNIPVKVIHNKKSIDAVIERYDAAEEMLIVKPLEQSNALSKDDEIYTNGYQENQVADIYIGKIEKVEGTGSQEKYMLSMPKESYQNLEVVVS